MGLRVLGGQVEVRAPVRTSQGRIREFVHAKGRWVLDKLMEHRERPQIAPLGSGETAVYHGFARPIWVSDKEAGGVEVSLHDGHCGAADPSPLSLNQHHFHVTAPAGQDEASRMEGIRAALIAWYRARAEEAIREAVDEWRPFVAPRAKPKVRISNAGAQWGSCSADGVLRFSWRCMMLRPHEIEYIVVHELAHLKVRNHSKAFWRVVAEAFSGVEAARRSIRQASRELPR